MSRRSLTLLIATVGVIAALAVSVLVSVPYVILGPGPTLNTLGQDSTGKPLITITGHTPYPTNGHLNMVTVGYRGGPGVRVNIFNALAAWLNPHEAVVPESELFPPGQTQQQAQQADTQQMTGSQQDAVAAALTQLHISYQLQEVVVQPEAGFPAAAVLKAGDVITAVDGQAVTANPVTGQSNLTSLIGSHPAGSTLTLTIVRNGRSQAVQVGTKESGGRPVMGVQVTGQFKFPFTVNFSVPGIGGARAGEMVALRLIDKLTKTEPTRGQVNRRDRGDGGQGEGGPDRRHPAEDGGSPRRGRDDLPGPRVQLLQRQGRDPGRPAGGQGQHAQPGRHVPGRHKGRPSRPGLLILG